MFPKNSTELSFAGACKWILVIFSIPFWVRSWQGIVERKAAVSKSEVVGGDEALRIGLLSVLYGCLFLAAAAAVWYFWQRNED